MHYSDEIRERCLAAQNELIRMVKNKEDPFNFAYTNDYIMKYFKLLYDEKNASEKK